MDLCSRAIKRIVRDNCNFTCENERFLPEQKVVTQKLIPFLAQKKGLIQMKG